MEISSETFLHCFKDINKVTNINKYRSFQYRLLQRALTTNIRLYAYGMVDSKSCYFCKENDETIVHLLIFCRKVQPFWIAVEEFMYEHWQIQDFPMGGGAPTAQGGHQHTILLNFPENCMKSKEFGHRGGGGVPFAPPTHPPLMSLTLTTCSGHCLM